MAAAPVQPLKAITLAQWKTESDRWVGVNYGKGGMDRAGIDCWSLTAVIYLEVAGIALPRVNDSISSKTTPR